jgi:DNA polymerase I-like protein with 3'-5' exonuclease and polymerase domains
VDDADFNLPVRILEGNMPLFPKTRQVTLGNRTFTYLARWAGEKFGRIIAVDTETTCVEMKAEIPELCLMQVSDGHLHALVHPRDVDRFLTDHADRHFVTHNAAFDFHVLAKHTTPVVQQLLWKMVDEGRLSDTMILDMLIRLAKHDEFPDPRDLGTVANKWADMPLDKADPYRLRYAEIRRQPWTDIDVGFWTYAIKDPIATWHAYGPMRDEARKLALRHGVSPAVIAKYGPLTENIQVKKAIALAQITRNGIEVDCNAVRRQTVAMREELAAAVKSANAVEPVFKTDGLGGFVLSGKARTPSINQKTLLTTLAKIRDELDVPIPSTDKGAISRSTKVWAEYANQNTFLDSWIKASGLAKLLQFFTSFADVVDPAEVYAKVGADPLWWQSDGPMQPIMLKELIGRRIKRKPYKGTIDFDAACQVIDALALLAARKRCLIHPRYTILVRTGRTSCSDPNLQQIPRRADFRSLFVAPAGYKMLTSDYSAIELRTLAVTCYETLGKSALGDVIKAGVDPHAYTASMIVGMTPEAFLELKESDPKTFKQKRQAAKACFSHDTELLTERGWRPIGAIYNSDTPVAQYNPHTKQVTFVRPQGWICRGNATFLEISEIYMNHKSTLDHRMLLVEKNHGQVREVLAQDMPHVPECWLTVHGGLYHQRQHCGSLRTRLSVMVQADGSFQGSTVRFGFSKSRKIKRCRELLTLAGVAFTERIDGSVTTFRAPCGDWYLLTADKHFTCYMDYDFEAFVDEVRQWDGCVTEKHAASFGNTSYADVTVVQTILCLTGHKAVLYTEPQELPKHDYHHVRWYRGDVKKNPEYARHNPGLTITTSTTGGDAYCCSVPTSWLMTRRAGKVTVSGNCNFGVPGGLGAKKLAAYAHVSYGVSLSVDEAETFRRRIITEIYPELESYLNEDAVSILARNLRTTTTTVIEAMGDDVHLGSVYKILEGTAVKKDGTAYKESYCDLIWNGLMSANRHMDLTVPLGRRQVGQWLADRVCLDATKTTTGRVRGRVGYSQVRNSPFQGLAADGAALTLYRLVKEGFKVVGFIHDEVIVLLPEETATDQQPVVEKIMCDEMSAVCDGFPIAVESHLDTCWSK